VWLIRKMVKTAPAQMATRQTKNAAVEYRPNLLNGASVRVLSTTSSATLIAVVDHPGPLYTLCNLDPKPFLYVLIHRSA
jgi:hypothetical protein